jgi:hypothetical protein
MELIKLQLQSSVQMAAHTMCLAFISYKDKNYSSATSKKAPDETGA